MNNPTLWSTENPYLYTVDTSLAVAGNTADTTTTRFGIRWTTFDPNLGFSLDGKPMKLQGVDLHHTLGAIGAATNMDAIKRQLMLMKNMGVNALRTSHNPPSPEVIEACDELGIVMMVEAFDTWQTPKVPFDYGRFFDANSDSDLKEMVNSAKNDPAVIMWSIGNEIPDSTSVSIGVPIAKRLVADVKSIDTTRPVVMGSDKYRTLPPDGSAQDQILRMLDGIGLNYNTAQSLDALHAKYPTKFFFQSETSSVTTTRGVYDSPDQLNTGENYTPGNRTTSSYDNNLSSWTTSAEYALKIDRDRQFLLGQFLWSGTDYIGEPTPYDNTFPVKSSFFGAADTAGFPKDDYYLFQSQWTGAPMVHLLPTDWTDHQPGDPVEVWAYTNADSVELFLNGKSLGVRNLDAKTTTFGTQYRETTEPTGDDKNQTTGPFPGSYTSPNGSAGKLHLSWTVPFATGQLVAVAKRNGVEAARDVLTTAGAPAAIRLTPDRTQVTADGRSMAFVTADVVDANGVVVPDAANELTFHVAGGKLSGLDNGQEESAENYQSTSRAAFHGKTLAIIQSGQSNAPITVTATAPGLRADSASIRETGGTGGAVLPPAPPAAAPAAAARQVTADAGFSGAPNTIPAAMLDGNTTSGGWSNFYSKAATNLLPQISAAHASDWVSVTWPSTQRLGGVQAYFTTDTAHALPASIAVSYWDGRGFVPVPNLHITWATASNQPTQLSFDPVSTTKLKLDMTSSHPGASNGFLEIAELTF